jgi:HEAT repeat protein
MERLAEILPAATIDQRRAALQALGTFVGRDVVVRLISLLGDKDATISQQANACLLAQPDKQLVAQLLESTLTKSGDKLVLSRIKDLMSSLRRTE